MLIMFLFKKNNLQKTKSQGQFRADADIGLVIINALNFKELHASSRALPDELPKASTPHSRVGGNHLSLGIMSRKEEMEAGRAEERMSCKAARNFTWTCCPASISTLQPDSVHTRSRDLHSPSTESQKQDSLIFHNLLHRQVTSLLSADPKAEDSQELTQERRQVCNRIKVYVYRDLKPKCGACKSVSALPSSMSRWP